jgi:RNA polymerase sigma-70 factor (ECF subfamily)
MTELETLVQHAQAGDREACGRLVERMQRMVFAICYQVLSNHADALDSTQEVFLRAFRRLASLQDPAAFPGWIRRIAITCARDAARRHRFARLQLDALSDPPVLDEQEVAWSAEQRLALVQALRSLPEDDRRVCDRFYHGHWSIERLAANAGASEPAMRKRLQRIRDYLRKETEMNEQESIRDLRLPANLSHQVVELLARPVLVDLPENPVGRIADMLRALLTGYRWIDIPEVLHEEDARTLFGQQPHLLPREFIHFIDDHRFLRYDVTLPLLLAAKNNGAPARLGAVAKVYRNESTSSMRDQSFHQLEILLIDKKENLDAWGFMGQPLRTLSDLLPGCSTRIDPVDFPGCSRAWEISIEHDGNWLVVLSWGVYAERVVQFLGADPQIHTAIGLGYGLERLAALHFHCDDIRRLAEIRLPPVPGAKS